MRDDQFDAPDEATIVEPADAPAVHSGATRVDVDEAPGRSVVERLLDGPPRDRLLSWGLTLGITAVAFVLRLVTIGRPKTLVFDETYYPKDAWTMLHLGYEGSWPDKFPGTKVTTNDAIQQGFVDFWKSDPSFVVHPPLGKWLIALGEHFFGMNSVGWRVAPLVFGTLLVLVTIRLARRLSRSTWVGALAGVLLTFDGLAFVMSRIGLLDIFQAFFLMAAVSCVAADRDWFRHRLADHLISHDLTDLGGAFGPALMWRPWRFLAGLMFGCAIAVKWNSMFVLAAMGVFSVVMDLNSRRLAGAGAKSVMSLVRDGLPAFVWLVVVAFPVYLASWTGWLMSSGGWDRGWGADNPDAWTTRTLGAPLASLWQYHKDIYAFHTGTQMMTATHTYSAKPWGWLIMQRPIGIDAVNDIKPGVDGCKAVNDTCLRVISGAGTPILWWLALVALVAGVVWWVLKRDWALGLPIVAAMATYLPWFKYDSRPLFFFYAICIIPFTVTVLAIWLGRMVSQAREGRRRAMVALAVAVALLVAANFAFMYPVYTDGLLTHTQWMRRMWFRSWI